jgi:hypothetical protein
MRSVLSRRFERLQRTAPVEAPRRRRLERREEGLVFAQGFEIRIPSREHAVLGIERNCTLKMSDGLGVLAPLRMSYREHVQRVIVVRVFVAHEAQVRDRLVVAAPIERQRRRIQSLFDRLRGRVARRRVALADLQIQPNPLVQLLLFRIPLQDGSKAIDGGIVIVPLKRIESLFLQPNRLDVRRADGRSRSSRLSGRLCLLRGGLTRRSG